MPNPIRTWGEFKRLVESQGMRDGDLLAWIEVDADNPTQVIVYDFNPFGKVVEHVDNYLEGVSADVDETALESAPPAATHSSVG